MSEREDNVYKAKLTEQAERYDGNLNMDDMFTNRWTKNVTWIHGRMRKTHLPVSAGYQFTGHNACLLYTSDAADE